MSTTKKKRDKRYQGPKYPSAIVGAGLVLGRATARYENSHPLRGEQLTDLGAGYMLAMTNLTQGNASRESWECVVCALNIGMCLAETVFDHQYEEEFVLAMDGAFRANIRYHKTGNFRLDGNAIRAIQIALEVHGEQLKLVQRKEIVAALEIVQRRVKEGNVYKSAEVMQ